MASGSSAMPEAVDTDLVNPIAGDLLNAAGQLAHHTEHTRLNDGLKAVERIVVGPTVINVKSDQWAGGAKGDGSTDDTAAFAAAVAACPPGGDVDMPPGYYKFSSLTINKPLTFNGLAPWSSGIKAAFGNAGWATTANFGGAVLMSTATSGAAITYEDTTGKTQPFNMRDVLLIGPGSGTSTGLKIGTAAHGMTAGTSRNVQVSNFAKAGQFNFWEECVTGVLRSIGCSTGFELLDACNNNIWDFIEVQFSSVDGLLIGLGAALPSSNNRFAGGLIQNCTGNGINDTDSYGTSCNSFDSWWFENAAITKSVWFKCNGSPGGPGGKSLTNCFLSANEVVQIDARASYIGPNTWGGGGTLVFGSTATGTTYIESGTNPSTFTDNTTQTRWFKNTGETRIPSLGGHLASAGTAPGIAIGAAAGTGATCSINGNDISGVITLNTGTGAAGGSATLFTLTWATGFTSGPRTVIVEPLWPAYKATSVGVSGVSTTTATVGSNTALPSSTSGILLQYFVIA